MLNYPLFSRTFQHEFISGSIPSIEEFSLATKGRRRLRAVGGGTEAEIADSILIYGWIWLDLWLQGVYPAFLDEYGWIYGC
jgi:hypothetical protein